ncbi:signal peptidase II [Patescibacteria group bacterium]|nr:signal peptidase II [Patescibacteria group bacterium]MBU1015715.1 signal peptidase II [Patescibacteria group bacterium]MBU1684887.1 signal peptidase II [Patescibacteria group bacterium]MBU1938655.1 signal peptidase II [Patescibacteria group bacterium]
MQNKCRLHWVFFVAGILDILILDFVTKLLVAKEVIKPFVFIRDFFYITSPHKNDGIAFGIDLPLSLQIAGSMIILFLLYKAGIEYICRPEKPAIFKHWLLGAIIGGGLGNLVDRIFYGYVVDFIVLRPFPVFNVADIGITVGLVVLFATIWLSSRQSESKN